MCDTWIAMSNATEIHNIILGKNSDRPIFDCQPLLLYPQQEWPQNSKRFRPLVILTWTILRTHERA